MGQRILEMFVLCCRVDVVICPVQEIFLFLVLPFYLSDEGILNVREQYCIPEQVRSQRWPLVGSGTIELKPDFN